VYNAVTGEFAYTTPTTDGITEGTQNLFYTDQRSRAAISVVGAGISYDSNTGVISLAGPTTLTGVQCTGTAGQFSCGSTPLYVGNIVTVSGTLTGTATISGYSDSTTYYVIATNGTTTFQLSATESGSPITTTAGTTVGLSFLTDTVGGATHIAGLIINDQAISGQTQGTDISFNPNGGYVKMLGDVKFSDDSVQSIAFPGFAGWTNTGNVNFTTTGASSKVALNIGSNSLFVDSSGAHLKAGTSVAQLSTTGTFTVPGPLILGDGTAQTTAYNLNSFPNSSVFFKNAGVLSSSTKLTYVNDQLNVDTINVKDINFTGSGTVDISSNSNLQIGAVGTISINGAYTIPTNAGSARKSLTTNGTNAATWEYTGADADHTTPTPTAWKTRTYNGFASLSFITDTTESLNVVNAVNSAPGSIIYVDITSFPTVGSVPVGAKVTGSGVTNANVVTSAQDNVDPTKWKIVIDQTGTFTTSSSFDISWGDAGTGPVVWWDAANSPEGATNFRGAIIEYHAFCKTSGMVVGNVIISNNGTNTNHVTHTQTISGSNQMNAYSFWNINNDSQVRFSGAQYDQDVYIQWTSRVFYGPETY
jgi:hypothetical protein